MNDNIVEPQEILYRGITTKPNMWKPSGNRPSSAAFKQTNGSLSVDRDGGREYSDIRKNLILNVSCDLKAIAFFPASKCLEKKMLVTPDPVEHNLYHALINDSCSQTGVGKKKARYLALECKYSLVS